MRDNKKFWSSTELADAAGLSRQYVVELLNKGQKQGGIEGYKAGAHWVILDSEARRWLAERGVNLDG